MEAYKAHLISRIENDLRFLRSQAAMEERDWEQIRSCLPASTSTPISTSSTLDQRFVPPVPQRPASATPPLGQARAMWDYEANQPDDLPLRTGDTIDILEETNADWWRGSCNGRTGLFPSNHVERIAHSSSTAGTPAPFHQHQQQPWFTQQQPPLYSSTASSTSGPLANSNGYYDEKQPFSPAPGSQPHQPPQQQQLQPIQPPPQQQQLAQQPADGSVDGGPPVPPRKPRFGKTGKMMANSFAGGLGFGAGAAVAGDIVNHIF